MKSSHPDFDRIVQAYRDRYGVDLSHMRMKWSKHPVYTNGERSYDFADDETGGSWVDDGTIRINPDMRSVMNRFGVHDQKVKDFRNRIIAHELAHEIWFKQNRKAKVKRLIRDSLAKAREENFTTPYLDTYPADTPKRKFDSELFAEYMANQLNKKASSKRETYESGEGEVESYTKDKTKDHDEIVLRTKDGRRIVISNNTRLGKALKPRKGDSVGYHGYGVKGTNVVHKVHPNKRQRGGWLEHVKAASAKGGEMTEKERKEKRRRILRRAIIASIGAGALAAPAYYAHRLNRAGEAVSRIHDETNPHLSLGQLEKELNRQEHLPKVRVGSLNPLSLSRLFMRFKSGVPVYAKKHKGGYMNAAAVAKYNPNDPQKGFDRPFVLSLTTHPKILAHELGHVIDYKNGTFVRENLYKRKSRLKEAILTVIAPSKTTQMQNEIRAWDNAKVDASDPLRRAALGTYFAGQKMNLAKDLKGPVALSSAIALGYDMKRGKKKREEEEEKDSKKEQKTK